MKKLLLILVGIVMAFSANAAWYISGVFQGWSHCNANYELTETTSGVYELSFAQPKTMSGEFLIVQGTVGSPDWSNKIGTNGSKVNLDTPYEYKAGTGNFSINGVLTVSKITLDTNNKTLLLTGVQAENEYDTVYMVGDFGSGWNDSDSNTSHPLALKAGTTNVWEADYTLSAATSYIKLRAGNYLYATGGADVNMVSGETYTATQVGEAFALAAGTYHFEFVLDKNADSGLFTATADGGDTTPPTPDYSSWYVNVIGNFNNWQDNGLQPVDGITKHTNLAIGNNEFKVKIWNGTNDVYYSTGTAIAQDEWVAIDGDAFANMTIAGATEGMIFDVEFDCASSSIKVTYVSGGETPVEYPTLYLRGELNNWGYSDATKFTETDGVYTLSVDELDGEFKIANEDWSINFANGNTEMAIDTEYVLSAGGENMKMAEKIKNATLTFTLATNTLVVTGSIEPVVPPTPTVETSEVVFTFNGENNNIASFTPAIPTDATTWKEDNGAKANTKYTIGEGGDAPYISLGDVTITSKTTTSTAALSCLYAMAKNINDVTFRPYKNNTVTISVPEGYTFVKMDATTNTTTAYSKFTFSNGTATVDAASNKNFTWTPATDDVTEFTFTVSTTIQIQSLTFTLAKVAVPVEYPTLYLRGAVNSWGADDDYKFAEADGVYTLTVPVLEGEFKIAEENWNDATSATTNNRAMELDTEYATESGAGEGNNMAMAAPKVLDATIVYNSLNGTLKVTGTIQVFEYPTLYLRGGINN